MTTIYFKIELGPKTYYPEVEQQEGETEAHVQDYAELITIDQIAEDFGLSWNEAAEYLHTEGTVTMSLTPLEPPTPVLYNMLTGEKTVGEPGMSHEHLMMMMHMW